MILPNNLEKVSIKQLLRSRKGSLRPGIKHSAVTASPASQRWTLAYVQVKHTLPQGCKATLRDTKLVVMLLCYYEIVSYKSYAWMSRLDAVSNRSKLDLILGESNFSREVLNCSAFHGGEKLLWILGSAPRWINNQRVGVKATQCSPVYTFIVFKRLV